MNAIDLSPEDMVDAKLVDELMSWSGAPHSDMAARECDLLRTEVLRRLENRTAFADRMQRERDAARNELAERLQDEQDADSGNICVACGRSTIP